LGEFSSALVKQCDKDHGFKLSSFCTCVLNDFYSKILAKTVLECVNAKHIICCVHLFHSHCGLWVMMLCSVGSVITLMFTVGIFSATKASNISVTHACMHTDTHNLIYFFYVLT
jgi:hypothetical protein